MDIPVPISIGDKISAETDYRDQLIVNYTMVERAIKGDQGYILAHPGIEAFGTGIGIDRGAIFNDRITTHLRISGQRLIEVDSSGLITEIGVVSGSFQASLPYSFQTQGIISDGRFWLYDGDSFIEVDDPDVGSPIDAVWINGVYFLTDGEFLYHTRADSESAIDPQTFATSEFSPDRTFGLLVNIQNQVVVFNRYSTEWFSDVGTANEFRFRRIQGKSTKVGIVGTHCKVEMNGQIFILGGRKEESPSIHILESGQERTIATREIDKVLATYTELELRSCVLEARVEERDKFLIVRLERDTLLYNLTIATKFGSKYGWTILKSGITSNVQSSGKKDEPWRARNGIFDPRISKWVYGDALDDRIGTLSNTIASQYGDKAEFIFYTPIITIEDMSINELELQLIPGFATDEVIVFVSLSYNGITYGQEFTLPASTEFDYDLRFIARRLGYIRQNFNLKFRVVSVNRTAFSTLKLEAS